MCLDIKQFEIKTRNANKESLFLSYQSLNITNKNSNRRNTMTSAQKSVIEGSMIYLIAAFCEHKSLTH